MRSKHSTECAEWRSEARFRAQRTKCKRPRNAKASPKRERTNENKKIVQSSSASRIWGVPPWNTSNAPHHCKQKATEHHTTHISHTSSEPSHVPEKKSKARIGDDKISHIHCELWIAKVLLHISVLQNRKIRHRPEPLFPLFVSQPQRHSTGKRHIKPIAIRQCGKRNL